jgi:hypothetical protein
MQRKKRPNALAEAEVCKGSIGFLKGPLSTFAIGVPLPVARLETAQEKTNGSSHNVCAFCRLENRDTASRSFRMRAVTAPPEGEVFETNSREASRS